MGEIKVFTVEEANAMLPKIIPILNDLKERRELILQREIEIDALEIVSDRQDNSKTPEIRNKLEAYNRIVSGFYELVETLHESGCLLKDVETGLVDFYHLYQGRMVHLCWKLGEEKVEHWHEVGSGFANRRPLNE